MKIDITHFNTRNKIACPYLAYFLGFFWGDGWLFKSKKWQTRGIGCDQNKSDFKHVKAIFERVLPNWKNFVRIIKGKSYPRIYKVDWEVYDFLITLGYGEKSGSHNKVLNILDDGVKRYFVLGLFDADGCIRAKTNGSQSAANIVGPINQNWGSLQRLLKKNNIETYIDRIIDKNGHKYSYLKVKNQLNILEFYTLLYKDTHGDLFFKRKKKIFDKVIEYLDKRIPQRYGSTKYMDQGRYDYTCFPFRFFKVTKLINQSSSDWEWECLFPNGRREVYSSVMLGSIKKQEERGVFRETYKSKRRFNRVRFIKKKNKWLSCIKLSNGKSWSKITDSEEEAAKMADYGLIYYRSARANELNFPELYDEYIKTDLNSLCYQAPNSSQYWGVSYCKPNKNWRASFQHNGKKISCGCFDSQEEAHEAVQAKLKELAVFKSEVES